jgi:hypothetical protein
MSKSSYGIEEVWRDPDPGEKRRRTRLYPNRTDPGDLVVSHDDVTADGGRSFTAMTLDGRVAHAEAPHKMDAIRKVLDELGIPHERHGARR